jgi:hypothetical protein
MIFMHLLNAKKIITFNEKNNKVAPIVLIEEPECFLHPSAQAEFGRVLQDLAKEFRIQVIVTTHSPYLLSHKSPESNILVEREIEGKKIKQTKLIETTPEKWFEPFALALGISGNELSPFKNTFFSEASEIILVEGEIDKEYLELLKNKEHGENRLNFTGDIFPYGGVSNLENNVLVRFIKERFHKFLVSVDLDRIGTLKLAFSSIGLEENKHYIPIGIKDAGKDNIEGLLPTEVRSKVYAENSEIVTKALSNSKDSRSYKQRLKRLLLNEFKRVATPNNGHYTEFYKLAKKINKVFKK